MRENQQIFFSFISFDDEIGIKQFQQPVNLCVCLNTQFIQVLASSSSASTNVDSSTSKPIFNKGDSFIICIAEGDTKTYSFIPRGKITLSIQKTGNITPLPLFQMKWASFWYGYFYPFWALQPQRLGFEMYSIARELTYKLRDFIAALCIKFPKNLNIFWSPSSISLVFNCLVSFYSVRLSGTTLATISYSCHSLARKAIFGREFVSTFLANHYSYDIISQSISKDNKLIAENQLEQAKC